MEQNKIYKTLLSGNFDAVEKEGEGAYLVKRYGTMEIQAHVDRKGEVKEVTSKATWLAWAIGIIFFPFVTIALWLYMNSKRTERTASMRRSIAAIVE